MDKEVLLEQSKMSELRDRLLAIEKNRLAGKAGISVRDLNIELRRIIDGAKGK